MTSSDEKIEQLIVEEPKKKETEEEKQYLLTFNTLTQYNITHEYNSNIICTSKYTAWSAFPKILFEQFTQVGNLYFLVLAILQMIPQISQSGGSPILLIPLMLVVGVNGLKDFAEDYKRKKSDSQENNTPTRVINKYGFKDETWADLHPGDFVIVKKDEYFPADLLLMYSTNKNGVAFVETKNLDGETNLKYKEAPKDIYKFFPKGKAADLQDDDFHNFMIDIKGSVFCNFPTPDMYDFEGSCNITAKIPKDIKPVQQTHTTIVNSKKSLMALKHSKTNASKSDRLNDKPSEYFALDYNNFLLRGSSLRNTDYIIGYCLFTGHKSKIMLNSLNARSKKSNVSRTMNIQLIIVVGLQLLISIVYSIVVVAIETDDPYQIYFQDTTNYFISVLIWILAINNLVPISLLVTMEMIRYSQAIFINWDITIYDKANQRGAIVQSSGLNDELGQIHNIFTDKTGTLTKNIMQFKYMIIGNKRYGSDSPVDEQIVKKAGVTNVDFNDDSFFKDWNDDNNPIQKNITEYVFALALCHTVISEKKDGKIVYNASSPDELSLVNAAKFFGAEFLERNEENDIVISFRNDYLKYKLLHILEFNSDRKRMSILLKDLINNRIILYTKGADSLITPRISDITNLQFTLSQLEYFGTLGLRTLLLTQRIVSNEVYEEFNSKYQTALMPKNAKQKNKIIDECYEILEQDLCLLGVTAIEDCLQDNLQSTLIDIRKVGIKIWMLTGDHPFTAVSIGHSSGLVNHDDKAVIVDSTKSEEINKRLLEAINNDEKESLCLVITGNALNQIMKPEAIGLNNLFRTAMMKAECVICSRVSPKQKADIVNFVKSIDKTKIALAIGDGANDVNMINAADVGIGIYGNEGTQAARASDYAIAQFSFIRRLLFVHGYESYRKNTYAVCYILWKNFLYALPIICFAITNRFSGQLIYDSMMDTFYNIVFTAFPIGWYAVTDHEIAWDKLEKTGFYRYKKGMENEFFNWYVIARWYAYGFATGVFLCFIHWQVFSDMITYKSNNMYDMWTMGTSISTCVVMIVNFKLFFDTNVHTFYTTGLILFSVTSYFIVFVFFSNAFSTFDIFYVWDMLIYSLHFWATLALIILFYFTVEYGWRSVQYYFLKVKKKIDKLKAHYIEEKLKKKQEKDLLPYSDYNQLSDYGIAGHIFEGYTGYAFSEDVANVDLINNDLEYKNIEIKENIGIIPEEDNIESMAHNNQ